MNRPEHINQQNNIFFFNLKKQLNTVNVEQNKFMNINNPLGLSHTHTWHYIIAQLTINYVKPDNDFIYHNNCMRMFAPFWLQISCDKVFDNLNPS